MFMFKTYIPVGKPQLGKIINFNEKDKVAERELRGRENF